MSSGHGINILYEFILYYTFLKKTIHHPIGHNALAGLIYIAAYFILFTAILTGFALHSQGQTGLIWYLAGGLFNIFSGATIRLIHSSTMWLLTAYLLMHVYIIWHNDDIEGNGLISSIFNGYKIIED